MSATPDAEVHKDESKEASPSSSSTSTAVPAVEESTPEPTEHTSSAAATEPPATAWQAIFSPQFNAYYFFNSETQETTWTNPLQPSEPAGETAETPAVPEAETTAAVAETEQPDASIPHYTVLQNAAIAQGIDPHLAYLDPSLAASTSSGGPSTLPSFQAKFNARTGQFAAMDSRSPAHLSEYERAKRMSEVFFDVAAWEQDLAARNQAEAEGSGSDKKRKRPSKKDLERFKQQKKLKKIAKTAWLRT